MIQLSKQTYTCEIMSHMAALQSLAFEDANLVEAVKSIQDRYQYIIQNSNLKSTVHDLRRMYNPTQLIYSHMLMKG